MTEQVELLQMELNSADRKRTTVGILQELLILMIGKNKEFWSKFSVNVMNKIFLFLNEENIKAIKNEQEEIKKKSKEK